MGHWRRGYDAIESYVLGLLLLAVFLLLILQIVARLLGTSALGWTEEAARYLFIWLVFVGAGCAVRSKSHIMADILRPKSDHVAAIAWLVMLEALIALTAACLLKYGIDLVRVSSNTTMVSLGMSMAYLSAAIPTGAALMLAFSLANMAKLMARLRTGKPEEKPARPF